MVPKETNKISRVLDCKSPRQVHKKDGFSSKQEKNVFSLQTSVEIVQHLENSTGQTTPHTRLS